MCLCYSIRCFDQSTVSIVRVISIPFRFLVLFSNGMPYADSGDPVGAEVLQFEGGDGTESDQ